MIIWAVAVSQPRASPSLGGAGGLLCSTGTNGQRSAGRIYRPAVSFIPSLAIPNGRAKEEFKKRDLRPPGLAHHGCAPGTACSVSLLLDLVLVQQKIGIRLDENRFY